VENAHIMVVDDEAGIREMIREYMEASGFAVSEAPDGMAAISMFEKESPDLIVLDVMMPKVDGWMVVRRIRETSRVPIIMLSARGEEYDKLLGFELGVDDYMVKPFSPRELLARARAVLSRSAQPTSGETQPSSEKIVFSDLCIDQNAHSVKLGEEWLQMTPKEYDLLKYFAENPRHAFSREQLLSAVWGYDYFGDDRTVDTHVKTLRDHLGAYRGWIKTVWGVGYKFEPEDKK